MKNSEIVESGIENIEKYGWTQHDYGDEEIGFCTLGSMKSPTFYDDTAIVDILKPVWGNRTRLSSTGRPIVHRWNDEEGRTKEEVLDMMTEAAKYWRNQGE